MRSARTINHLIRSPRRTLTVSDHEWSLLLWALEVAHADLCAEPNVAVLLADPTISADLLDALADRLVTAAPEPPPKDP